MKKITITICMGSSCYSRGNSDALSILEEYIEKKNLNECTLLLGSLCNNCCSTGPNIKINDTTYNDVDATCVIDLLKHHLGER